MYDIRFCTDLEVKKDNKGQIIADPSKGFSQQAERGGSLICNLLDTSADAQCSPIVT